MASGHVHSLYIDGQSALHRMAPQCKVAAAFSFVVAVVATPREAFWAYALYALALAALVRLAGIPARTVLRRLTIEIPFVAFALMLPFIGTGARTPVAGLALSIEGLWGMWNILAKATLGLTTTLVLTATTPLPALLRGLERLHVPAAFCAVASFMVRYLDVVTGEMARMRVARLSRGHDPRWIWQLQAVATSAGALFIRSYERGERVHLAMLSRGFTGTLPVTEAAAPPRQWAMAMAAPSVAAVLAAAAWMVR